MIGTNVIKIKSKKEIRNINGKVIPMKLRFNSKNKIR